METEKNINPWPTNNQNINGDRKKYKPMANKISI